MIEPKKPCDHEWETAGDWGVILGLSCCEKCGKLATEADFPLLGEGAER